MMTVRTIARVLVASAVVGALTGPADGASRKDLERAEARATEGKAYFKSKLYSEAAEAFMDAYAIVNKPTLVYNAARAREENGEVRRAVALFTLYMGLPGIDAAGKRAARARMGALLRRIKAAEAKAAREKASRQRASGQRASRQRASRQRAAREKRERAARGGSASRFPLYRTAGAGALGIFAVVAQLHAVGLARDASLENLDKGRSAADLQAARDGARVWQGVAIGSGVLAAGLLGWAAYDWLIAPGRRSRGASNSAPSIWMAPSPGGFVAGLSL